MKEINAVLCPKCKSFISSYVKECPHCGYKNAVRMAQVMSWVPKINYSKLIIWINIIFFGLSFLLNFILKSSQPGIMGLPAPSGKSLFLLGMADPNSVFNGNQYWRLIAATFLHGGILHILFNMMWVKDLAPLTEKLLSPAKMLCIYILSGIIGNYVAISFTYAPVVGASGAIFGLMGGLIAVGHKEGGFWGKHLVRQIGTWAVILLVLGFLIPRVSNSAHIGGLISGLILGYLIPSNNNYPKTETYFNYFAVIIILLCFYTWIKIILLLLQGIPYFLSSPQYF